MLNFTITQKVSFCQRSIKVKARTMLINRKICSKYYCANARVCEPYALVLRTTHSTLRAHNVATAAAAHTHFHFRHQRQKRGYLMMYRFYKNFSSRTAQQQLVLSCRCLFSESVKKPSRHQQPGKQQHSLMATVYYLISK